MNLDKIVGKIIEGRGGGMIFHLSAETIGQARVTPHGCVDRPILAFYEGSRSMTFS
jgi:hypothetical protein